MISICTKTWPNSHQSVWPDIKGCQNLIVIKRRVHEGFGPNQRLRVCGKKLFFTERKLKTNLVCHFTFNQNANCLQGKKFFTFFNARYTLRIIKKGLLISIRKHCFSGGSEIGSARLILKKQFKLTFILLLKVNLHDRDICRSLECSSLLRHYNIRADDLHVRRG